MLSNYDIEQRDACMARNAAFMASVDWDACEAAKITETVKFLCNLIIKDLRKAESKGDSACILAAKSAEEYLHEVIAAYNIPQKENSNA